MIAKVVLVVLLLVFLASQAAYWLPTTQEYLLGNNGHEAMANRGNMIPMPYRAVLINLLSLFAAGLLFYWSRKPTKNKGGGP
ncbi:hypothetical protein ACFL04_00295 [Patescibacteria group bacterium]